MIAHWIQGFEPFWQEKQDADLWFLLHAQLQHARPFVHASMKVQAHAKPPLQETVLDEWAVWGNGMADLFAEEARQQLSLDFWNTWTAVKTHQSNTWSFGQALHKLFVQIGLRAQATSVANQVPVPAQVEASEALELDPGIVALSKCRVEDLPKHLQVDETQHVLHWLDTLTDQRFAVTWVSYHQLLVDYQMFSGRLGPTVQEKRWVSRDPYAVNSYPQQVQLLGRFVQNMAKAIKAPLRTDQRRPSSLTLTFWSGGIRVSISEERLANIDNFYKAKATRLPISQIVRDMSDIPPGFMTE